jgi:carbon-monoxide dehydrogenase catalytic subunit
MEFIQKKTADPAVEHFLLKAAEEGISLVWDRFEGQLPECGFCEAGLSCRDCLQGPCISHPFRDSNKAGVCGKDKDILAAQSLLRLVVKGTMAILDQVNDFVKGVETGEMTPQNKGQAAQIIREIQRLFKNGDTKVMKAFPVALADSWKEMGIYPEGLAQDLFKAAQKVEGGMASVEDTLLWAFKSSLLGCVAQKLQGSLKRSVFGDITPTALEVNLGVLQKETPNILLYGHFSPILKHKIAAAAAKKKIRVLGVCTDPLLPPYTFSPVTNYGSQEIPLMTGAVNLIVTGDQFVNPSLAGIAKDWGVAVVATEVLKNERSLDSFATQIVEKAEKAFEFRRGVSREIPENKESAVMGFSVENGDVKKIVEALKGGKIRGIVIFSGSGNVKFSQDHEIVTIARELLQNDIFCVSEGDASVSLAKYGFLNPQQKEKYCGKGVADFLTSLGKNRPSVLDFGSSENGGVTDFLLGIASVEKKALKDYPIVACFPEANRGTEVAEAMWTVAMGVPAYFWPCLPVTGSPKTMEALSKFCREKFGAKLHVITDKKMEPRAKANLIIRDLVGDQGPRLSGLSWQANRPAA